MNIYGTNKDISVQTELNMNEINELIKKPNLIDKCQQTEYFCKKNISTQTVSNDYVVNSTQTPMKNFNNISIQTENVIDELKENETIEEEIIEEEIIPKNQQTEKYENEIYFEEKIKFNESTKEAVLRRKRERKEAEEKKYLSELGLARDQYINKTKYIKKGDFFEPSNIS